MTSNEKSTDEDSLPHCPFLPGIDGFARSGGSSSESSVISLQGNLKIHKNVIYGNNEFIGDYESESGSNKPDRNEEVSLTESNNTCSEHFVSPSPKIYVCDTDTSDSKDSCLQYKTKNANIIVPETPTSSDMETNNDLEHRKNITLEDFSPTDGSDYHQDSESESTESDSKYSKRKNTQKKVVTIVNKTNNEFRFKPKFIKKSNRIWDRKNACIYCENLVTNFTRHLRRHHANEQQVIEYLSIDDPDKKLRKRKRQAITEKLRNRGNYLHNQKVCFEKDCDLLPNRRKVHGQTGSPLSYVICKSCLGTFQRSTFYRHSKYCIKTNEEGREDLPPNYKKHVISKHSITITPKLKSATKELEEIILPKLRNDEVSLVIKYDPLILAFGSRILKKKKERRSRKAICSKLRDLATLLIIVREKDREIRELKDLIDPKKISVFIDGVKQMCGFDENTGHVKITSVPGRLRPSIMGCIEILFTESLMNPNNSSAYQNYMKKRLDDFKMLIESNWQWEIATNAEKTRKRNLMMKPYILPLDEDIMEIMEKIKYLEEVYYNNLKKDVNILNYENLCEVTISHIIILDKKRSGDVAEAELTVYLNRTNEEIPLQVLKSLTKKQREAISSLDIFQIPGKRVRAVPILLTEVMRRNIDLLVTCREQLKIPVSNRYLFARPLTNEPFDGGKCLNRIKSMCRLKKPEMLTATGIRHHVATMSQIRAKEDDMYTEHLATFLGHEKSIHTKSYRLPLQVLQKGIVGSELLEIENKPYNKSETSKETESNTDCLNDNKENKTKAHCQNLNEEKIEGWMDKTCSKTKKRKNNKTPKRTKKTMRISDDETEIDNDEIKTVRNLKKKTLENSPESNVKNEKQERRKKVHVKWTEEEIAAVKRWFQENIEKKINPGKAKCLEILQKEPKLHRRTWQQLNTCVNNMYMKGSK